MSKQNEPMQCGALPSVPSPTDCSVRYVLKGLNSWSVWLEIRPLFATEEDARKEEAEYRKVFQKLKHESDNGWKNFCVVKRTTTEEVCTQNPSHHDGAATAPSVDGVVQIPNKENENGR